MAKGILKTPKPRAPKGFIKPMAVHDHVMKNTTAAQRAKWAHDYVKGFAAAQTIKRRMYG